MTIRAGFALVAVWLGILVASGAKPAPATTEVGHDANGNLTSKFENGVAWTYIYDTRNLLVEVQRDGLLFDAYQYDSEGRRIKRAGSEGIVRYIWDGDRIVLETDDAGNTLARYEYAGDRLLSFRHVTEGTAFYLFDGLGSPVNLSKPDGSLAARYSYDAWGELTAEVGECSNPFLFTSYQRDRTTGLYYAKARFYDSRTGRFLTEDPFEGGAGDPRSLHRYNYAYANPTFYVDPDGRCVGALQGTKFCQTIAEGFAFLLVGDPVANVDRDIEARDKVVQGRREFLEQVGRDPKPDEVVWSEGTSGLTAGFQEIDSSGRTEPDNAEWFAVPAGVGTGLAVRGARAAGATVGRQALVGAAQVADEAAGELVGISPRDAADVASLARQSWSTNAGPSGPSGTATVVESADGPNVDLVPGSADHVPTADAQDVQVMSAYPRDRRVAGGREGRRSTDPLPGFRESSSFQWSPDNISRMERGQPPIGADRRPIELHHRDQDPAGPLDEMTSSSHRSVDHPQRPSQIDRERFAAERRRYWIERVREAHGQLSPSEPEP